MCDKKNSVFFTKTECLVLSPDFKLLDESQVLLKVPRHDNMYSFDLKNVIPLGGLTCLFANATIDESNLWHRRLGHINFKTLNKLVRGNLVRGFPSKLFENDHTCVACQKGKQYKASCKTKLVSSINQPLQMLHMDLFGPTSVRSINHKTYCLVVTDDFSRFSWVFFLATTDETSGILKTFITSIKNQINHKVKIIRCDNGTEFKNNDMKQFCRIKGIKREFSVARTPQQNEVTKRKNRTLIEAARTMLADSLLPTTFWAEAVNTACYVLNRVLVTKPHNKTPYELLHGIPPSISFMRPFGCPVTILNTLDPIGKFDGKADEGFLVGYSINSKAFRVFNTRTRKVEENLHITFHENKPNVAGSGPDWLFDIDLLTNTMNYESVTAGNQTNRNAVADDAGKNKTEEPANEGERNGQEKEGGASNKDGDQNVQDLRVELDKLLVSAAGQSFINADDLSTDPLKPTMKDTTDLLNTGIFNGAYDDEDVGAEAHLNNLETTMNVSPIPTTRIHKDHPKDQIIGDINSATQTRRMTKISEEHHTREFTRTILMTYPSWIEAMSDELLQFRLQKVWRLVDLPKGKHAIGTKWVYRNKKDERGIVVRNKERLVAQVIMLVACLDRKSNNRRRVEAVADANCVWTGVVGIHNLMLDLGRFLMKWLILVIKFNIEPMLADLLINRLLMSSIRFNFLIASIGLLISEVLFEARVIKIGMKGMYHYARMWGDGSGIPRYWKNGALEIGRACDKEEVKSLEKIRKSRTLGFKILRKVGSASRVESSNDVSLGAQEDASKQGRKIDDLDADAEVTLVDKTQEMNDDNLMFDFQA
ncbi:putative ribonuclease H-like domain-containing protein [Tanacetum coccineum]